MAGRGKNVSFWIFIIVLVVLHLTVHVAIGIGGLAPDLLTIALLLGARRLGGAGAAGLGLGLGVLNDAMSLTAFGALAVSYSIAGVLGARSRDMFEGDSLLFVAVYVFLGKWVTDLIYLFLARNEPWSYMWSGALLVALYTAIAAMIALTLYRAATSDR